MLKYLRPLENRVYCKRKPDSNQLETSAHEKLLSMVIPTTKPSVLECLELVTFSGIPRAKGGIHPSL